MELERAVKISMLLDEYGPILTSKKREILSMYVNDNMSYMEIGSVLGISKPAVLDSIRVAEDKLMALEQKLGFWEFKQKLLSLANSSTNLKQDIISLLKE